MPRVKKNEEGEVVTLDEIVPITRVEELLKSNILDQLTYVDDGDRTAEDWRQGDFSILLQFFQHQGKIRRYYSPSKRAETNDSRLYCGNGLQLLSRQIRGYLCQDNYVDIDIENSHPNILLEMMIKQDVECPLLTDYCHNRKRWIAKYPNIKKLVLSQLNDNHKYKNKDLTLSKFMEELYNCTQEVGGKMFDVISKRENELLMIIYNICKKRDQTVNALIYDGLILKKNEKIDSVVDAINKAITPFKVVKKEWELPTGLEIIDTQRFNYQEPTIFRDLLALSGNVYSSLNHFYMDGLPLLLKTTRVIGSAFITKNVLSNVHDSYEVQKSIKRDDFKVICGEKPFAFKELVTQFNRLINYANLTPSRFPTRNEFSVDSGFLCEHLPLPDDWKDRCEPFKKHILEVNANGNEKIADGFYWFYSNIIQTENKSEVIMITTGKQGSGKSILPGFIVNKILGSRGLVEATFSKVVEKFNSTLAGKRLVLVNEMSNIDSTQRHADGDQLKNLVDSIVFSLERKGIDKIKVPNYLEFIGCSNHRNCISQSDGLERRNFITHASDKYVNDHKYFDTLGEYLDDDKNIRSIFEFLKTFDVTDRKFLRKLPMTESKAEGIWKSLHPCVKACMAFYTIKTEDNEEEEEVKISKADLWDFMKGSHLIYGDKFNKIQMGEYMKQYPNTKPQNITTYHLSKQSLKYPPEVWEQINEYIEDNELRCLLD